MATGLKKHIIVGVIAAILLLVVYSSIIAIPMGLTYALQQTAKLWYWVLALAVGFGTQAGLFSFIRQGLRERRAAATASVATSGGVSAGSMAACCAHHLSDVLPLIGLSGLAAFVASYQTFFIVVGVLSNVVGIAIMLETIQRHGLCPWVAKWKFDMRRVKKWTMASAGLLVIVAFFLTRFNLT